jgi:hypothetical protein
MSQAHPEGKHKRYVTVLEAAELLNCAERTIFRMIGKQQRLASIKTADGSRWVDLDSIERKLQEKPRSASPVKHTLEHVLTLVEELQEQVQHQQQRLQELEQSLLQTPYEPVPRHSGAPTLQGIAGKLARRNLPAGTRRLVTFAEEHHLSAYAIKQWHEAGDIPLTVYTRPNPAKRNQNEWWITQGQHQAVIAYCQQHAIPYVACLHCPSQDETDQQAV